MSPRTLSAAALAGAALLLLSGCSSDDDTDTAAPEPTAAAADAGAEARTLSADELEQALLTLDELPAGYVEEPVEDEGEDDDTKNVSDDAECQALLDGFEAFGDETKDAPSASATFSNEGTGTLLDLTLESYEGDEASEGIAAMKAAFEGCGEWTEVAPEGEETPITAASMSFPQVGDETYAGHMTAEVEGMEIPINMVVSRVGKSVVVVSHAGFPEVDVAETEEILRASVEKLEKVSA